MNFYGFDLASPESVGVPSSSITAFMERLRKEGLNVHGFMLYRHGRLISKCVAPPLDFSSKRHIYSISKVFLATAVGIARDEGLLTLGDRVIDIFPESVPETVSENLARMTVHDLLCMACGHNGIAEPDMMAASDGDWVKAFFARKIPYVPGTHFQYNSGGSYMLSAIVTRLTGMDLMAYLEPRLFAPLGIEGVKWDACPKGIRLGGWGLHVSHEDMLKLGVLYLNGGTWNGKRLISRDWVKLASSYKISNGVDLGHDWGSGYGYHFWRCQHNCFRGDGSYGQLLIMSPDKDMVLSLISEDNNFQMLCNAYWDTVFASCTHTLSTYRMDPFFTEDMVKDDVLPENPEALAALRAAEAGFTAMPLLGGGEGALAAKLTVDGGAVGTVDVTADGNGALFTLFFRNGLVKMVRAGNGEWVMNRFDEFPRKVLEDVMADYAVRDMDAMEFGASCRMEGNRLFVHVQVTNTPHGIRFVIDLEAGTITKSTYSDTFTYTFAKV